MTFCTRKYNATIRTKQWVFAIGYTIDIHTGHTPHEVIYDEIKCGNTLKLVSKLIRAHTFRNIKVRT